MPYNFSTTASPLLKRAARALNLPARSKDSYMSVFGSLASSSTSASSTAPLDERYTGHILVSQYQISYVLPKEYPPSTRSYDSSYGRRSSAYELQFMAAIDIWIPYVSKPPSYPYLVRVMVFLPVIVTYNLDISSSPYQSLAAYQTTSSSRYSLPALWLDLPHRCRLRRATHGTWHPNRTSPDSVVSLAHHPTKASPTTNPAIRRAVVPPMVIDCRDPSPALTICASDGRVR